MLLFKYGVYTMQSRLETLLENAQNRYDKLSNAERNDMVTVIVLDRIKKEIIDLQKGIKNEEYRREESISRASTSPFTYFFKKAMCRYGVKCHSNNYTVS